MPQEMVANFAPKKTYIAHGAAFAPPLCTFHESQVLRGASVMWMLDNLSVMSCLCNGSLAVADILSLRLLSLRLSRHCDSHSPPAGL
eukprot:4992138-Heterocapsa_arctica.AAC.1